MADITVKFLEVLVAVVNIAPELEDDAGKDIGLGNFNFGVFIVKDGLKIAADSVEVRFEKLR